MTTKQQNNSTMRILVHVSIKSMRGYSINSKTQNNQHQQWLMCSKSQSPSGTSSIDYNIQQFKL